MLPPARIYPSLTRPVLLMGLERELAILYVGVWAIFLFAFPISWFSAVVFATLAVLYPVLRRLHERDPQALSVLVRHVRRSGAYEARRRPEPKGRWT